MSKFLTLEHATTIASKVKNYVQSNKPGVATASTAGLVKPGTGLSVDSAGVLTPQLKTVNGQSMVGSGNITIDLGVYKVVQTLPTAPAAGDGQKIHLVLDSSAPDGNKYKEYLYVDSKWELLGEYKAAVDLSPYALKSELPKTATASTTGVVKPGTGLSVDASGALSWTHSAATDAEVTAALAAVLG